MGEWAASVLQPKIYLLNWVAVHFSRKIQYHIIEILDDFIIKTFNKLNFFCVNPTICVLEIG